MIMKKAMTIFMLLAVLTACTQNDKTRNWGGKNKRKCQKHLAVSNKMLTFATRNLSLT